MSLNQPVAATISMIVTLTAAVATAQEAPTSPYVERRTARVLGPPPETVRSYLSEPRWVIPPNPQWPNEAGNIAEQVTVTSECAVSNSGRMRDCRITAESIPGKGFGDAFLRALHGARVETSSYRTDARVFRTTATFDPPQP